jgi:excinuclease ABC subunit C
LRGQDKKRHLLALENAKASIEVTQKDFELINTRLTLLQEALGLKRPIKRIECFDISHSMGDHTIASCVVFSDKGAEKKAYRTFLIKDIVKGDDYAAMAQVLTRRLNSLLEKDEVSLPDVILIDGGKGQLNVAKQVLESLQINEVILLAVSKGPSRKSGDEQLLLAESTVPLTLAINSPARHLIQFVRDESHRFAITAHRRKRGKKMSYSQLREIEGIGEKKQQQLIKRFLSINGIKKASIDEIANLSGFSRTLAIKIKDALV